MFRTLWIKSSIWKIAVLSFFVFDLSGQVFFGLVSELSKIVEGMGVWAEGPITNPSEVGPAMARALSVVDAGEPAFVDVRCQPR